jgi:cbb3-type cytochrome oxidase subunit 3
MQSFGAILLLIFITLILVGVQFVIYFPARVSRGEK